MRRAFADELLKLMRTDERIVLLTADVGYGFLDNIRDEMVERFQNVGAAEQAMIGMGVGLALAGKIPFCYSITPFLLYRPFELIRNYCHHEGVPLRLVGSGRDADYATEGITHDASDVDEVLSCLTSIHQLFPFDDDAVRSCVREMVYSENPCFLSLSR